MKYIVSATYIGVIDVDEDGLFEDKNVYEWVNELLGDPRNLDWMLPAATLDSLEVTPVEFIYEPYGE